MTRNVTPEEREILLNNPELVMFDPFPGFRHHRRSVALAFLPFIIVVICEALLFILFGKQFDSYPMAYTVVMIIAFLASAGIIPVLYLIIDKRPYRRAEENHYADQLRVMMPDELTCRRVIVDYYEPSKGEGGYIDDGRLEYFALGSARSYFEIVPKSELVILLGKGFWGFVKRDPKTGSLYGE